jgi:sugar-phosphatase
MKYKVIIFDMDGTIVDSEHIWKKANKTIIERRGISITPEMQEELNQKLSGLALRDSCQIIKQVACLDDQIDSLIEEKSRYACSLYAQEIRFIEGFTAFHQKALTLNIRMGVATNADDATLAITNQKLDLASLFGKHLYNITHVNFRGKPDPDLYLYAAKQLGVAPEECIAVEDSFHGIAAARAANMFTIGINTARNPVQLRESHMIINSYDDLNLTDLLYPAQTTSL